MDYYEGLRKVSRLFEKKIKVKYILSEETIETLRRWELSEDQTEDSLIKLKRMLHTAPASERDMIRKAIKDLEKKTRKVSGEEDRGYYKILGKWGMDSQVTDMIELNPDIWYRKEVLRWSEYATKTFIYSPYSNKVFVSYDISARGYSHRDFVDALIDGESITDDDVNPTWEMSHASSPDVRMYENIVNSMESKDGMISGRTGPFPLHEDPTETEFMVSIWNKNVDRKVLDKLMNAINDNIDASFRYLLVPESV